MSIHTVDDLAEAVGAEEAAIANAKAEMREAPRCTPACRCQCGKSRGCRDDELLARRAAEAPQFNGGEDEILATLIQLQRRSAA